MASNCLTVAKVLNIWMKKPENNSELDLFSKHLHSNLSKATRLLLNTKRMSKGREKVVWARCGLCVLVERSQWEKYEQIGYLDACVSEISDLQKSLILIYAEINDAENR